MSYTKIFSAKKIWSFLMFLTFSSLGVSCLYFKVIHQSYKIDVLLWTFVFSLFPVFYRIYKGKWSFYSLGFRLDNIKTSYKLYITVTIVGSFVLYIYSKIYHLTSGGDISTFFQYSAIGSMAQEFLYRVFLWNLGKDFFGEDSTNDIVNIILFSGMHVIYHGFWDNYLWLLMVSAGTLFTLLYKGKHKNIYLVTASHIELNFLAVYLGIFH